MMTTDRKSSYKLPPTTIRDRLISQEARRNKALEEQKRRRAQKIDSARQLDLFADLTLGASDDEDVDAEPAISTGRLATVVKEDGLEDEGEDARPAPGSVAHYAAMLAEGYQGNRNPVLTPSTSATQCSAPSTPKPVVGIDTQPDIQYPESGPSKSRSSKKKKGGAGKQKRRTNKPSKWADKCMYAELLEMSADEAWHYTDGQDEEKFHDGLPQDLESAWVAVAPVPAGKRCLAVTHTSAGVSGLVSNTTLRSRLLGKTLLARFPSILPPLTVLDCILDERWRENGILHVLDVIRWKGQDVGDCEAGFRFWWRDTRLAELGQPTKAEFQSLEPPSSSSPFGSVSDQTMTSSASQNKSTFSYPISFIPVPYHSNTTLAVLDAEIIPAARSWRRFSVPLPTHLRLSATDEASTNNQPQVELGMDIEPASQQAPFFTPISPSLTPHPSSHPIESISSVTIPAFVEPDGLLLYVSEASYEHGTSPLSSWIPIHSYDPIPTDEQSATEVPNEVVRRPTIVTESRSGGGPLDLFHRLVRRRLQRRGGMAGMEMDYNGNASGGTQVDANMDVSMDV